MFTDDAPLRGSSFILEEVNNAMQNTRQELHQGVGDERTIYLVSGPVGVGKSTTSRELAKRIERCVLFEADHLLHMFVHPGETPWENRLSITWEGIVALTRGFVQHGYNVVLDFVVEDELEWFCHAMSDLNAVVKYTVLRADRERLEERLQRRGDYEMLGRSLFLLEKLESLPSNQHFIYDCSQSSTEDIVEAILNEDRFFVRSSD